jgi:hypothetical protein
MPTRCSTTHLSKRCPFGNRPYLTIDPSIHLYLRQYIHSRLWDGRVLPSERSPRHGGQLVIGTSLWGLSSDTGGGVGVLRLFRAIRVLKLVLSCVLACVRACVRGCVRACVRACARVLLRRLAGASADSGTTGPSLSGK